MKSERPRLASIFELIATAFLFLFVLVQPLSIAATQIAYTGALFAWLLRLVLVGNGALRRSPMDVPILAYWLLCAVSATLAPMPASSWEGMRKVSLIFLVFLVAHNIPNIRRAKQLVTLLFLTGLVSVAWASWQYGAGVGLRVYSAEPGTGFLHAGVRENDVLLRVDKRLIRCPQEFLVYLNSKPLNQPIRLDVVHGGGIAILKDAVPLVVPAGQWQHSSSINELGIRIEKARPGRARAFYSHYVTYALLLVLLSSLSFGLYLSSSAFSRSGLCYVALFVVFTFTLGATLTRAAWLALAFGCAVQLWFHMRRWSVRLLLPVACLLAIGGTNMAMHRWRSMGVFDLHDPGTDYRLLMWRDGLHLIKEHPWLGVGMNTIRDSWWKFDLAAYSKYGFHWNFHSTPIQIAVEMGIPVLISWVVLIGCYVAMLLRLATRARAQGNDFIYGFGLGILGGTTGFVVSSLTQYDFGDSAVVMLFWFLAGVALALWHQLGAKSLPLARPTT